MCYAGLGDRGTTCREDDEEEEKDDEEKDDNEKDDDEDIHRVSDGPAHSSQQCNLCMFWIKMFLLYLFSCKIYS